MYVYWDRIGVLIANDLFTIHLPRDIFNANSDCVYWIATADQLCKCHFKNGIPFLVNIKVLFKSLL